MLQANPKIDPLVEILRLAYRRGLAIRQEESKEQPINGQEDDDEIQVLESKKSPCKQQPVQTGSEQ